jgi:hypothetical protein
MMNKEISNKIFAALALLGFLGITSCNEFLDREPLSNVTPDKYLQSEADLAAYTIARYNSPTHSGFNTGIQYQQRHRPGRPEPGLLTRFTWEKEN